MACKIDRIYNNLDERGIRVLVDRVWPRGISKDKANLDHWLKDIAPSSELRKWFNHEPSKFEAFKEKYKQELESGDQQESLNKLKQIYKENKTNTHHIVWRQRRKTQSSNRVERNIGWVRRKVGWNIVEDVS